MTTEELLQPRYKVIADYPLSKMYFDIGLILTWTGESYTAPDLQNKKQLTLVSMHKNTVESYPHLFKKLEWWEERKVEDMPEYVKTSVGLTGGRIAKARFDLNDSSAFFMYLDGEVIPYSPQVFEPATLEEYNAYQSKQNVK